MLSVLEIASINVLHFKKFPEDNYQYAGNHKLSCRPGVNFINLFTCSFYTPRPQKCKKLLELPVFFALLGSASVKAACKHVGEIDPWSLGSKAKALSKKMQSYYLGILQLF